MSSKTQFDNKLQYLGDISPSSLHLLSSGHVIHGDLIIEFIDNGTFNG